MSVLVQDTITTLAAGGRSVGVDAGTTTLLTLSTGQKVPNLRHERADRVRLAKAQRLHARKQKGSSNRGRARLKVGKVYARIAERRRDYLHKVTTGLVRENQRPSSRTWLRRTWPAATAWPEPSRTRPSGTCGPCWSTRGWYGREPVVVGRWFPSSKVCSACGQAAASMPLSVREWVCTSCGAAHDRDVNAAQNIRSGGLWVIACGHGMRPTRR